MEKKNRRRICKRIIGSTLLILWCMTIFWFSAKPAKQSAQMSESVGMTIGKMVIPQFNEWTKEQQEAFAQRIDHTVRKGAHVTEYAILGMLCFFHCSLWISRRTKWFWTSFLMGAFYAVTDEVHQLFVPGRSGELKDVLIDSTGVLIGVSFLAVLYYWNRKRKT